MIGLILEGEIERMKKQFKNLKSQFKDQLIRFSKGKKIIINIIIIIKIYLILYSVFNILINI